MTNCLLCFCAAPGATCLEAATDDAATAVIGADASGLPPRHGTSQLSEAGSAVVSIAAAPAALVIPEDGGSGGDNSDDSDDSGVSTSSDLSDDNMFTARFRAVALRPPSAPRGALSTTEAAVSRPQTRKKKSRFCHGMCGSGVVCCCGCRRRQTCRPRGCLFNFFRGITKLIRHLFSGPMAEQTQRNPLHLVHDTYGAAVAFYSLFIAEYTRALVWPSLIGVVVTIAWVTVGFVRVIGAVNSSYVVPHSLFVCVVFPCASRSATPMKIWTGFFVRFRRGC